MNRQEHEAWLPMITNSFSFVIPLDVLIIDSSSERFIFLENLRFLLSGQDAAKRAGLSQAGRFLLGAHEKRQDFSKGQLLSISPHSRRGAGTAG